MKKEQLISFNIQLFADKKNKSMEPTTVKVEDIKEFQEIKSKKSKVYSRDELNKIISIEREKVRMEISEKFIDREKITNEKYKCELEKIEKEKNEISSKLHIYILKEYATRIASEKGLDISLINMFDYTKETTDSIKIKLDNIDNIFNKAVNERVNIRLQEMTNHMNIFICNKCS